jgi:hypothetical protein
VNGRARQVLLAPALLAPVLIAGCSGSHVPEPGPSITPPVFAPATVLKSALITAADLPSGYSPDTTASSSPTSIGAADNATCAKQIASLDAVLHAPATAAVTFSGGKAQSLIERLGSFTTEAPAIAALTDVRSALADCHQFNVPSGFGGPVPLALTTLKLPKLGDDSLALQGKGTTDGLNIVLDVDLARNGSTLVVVAEGGLSADEKVITSAIRAGVLKLRAAITPASASVSSTPAP